MKNFDWKIAEETRNPKIVSWLRENHALPVSEERFINELALIYRTERALGKYAHLKANQYNKATPNHLRKMYKNLKSKFGFFPS